MTTPEPSATTAVQTDSPRGDLPRHVAIIMDGNGRWAAQRGLPRIAGHHAGVKSVRRTIEAAVRLGVRTLTLYSFSSENWKRPVEEVDALMLLARAQLAAQREELVAQGVRFHAIGRIGGLPPTVQEELTRTVEATRRGTRLDLVVALNYGGRAEIVDACRAVAEAVAAGTMSPSAIDEETIARHLSTAGLPDPDLLIRTAGEMRLSNFLLWQVSYAELHVTPVAWPDFDEAHLAEALRDFASRRRRFGGLAEDIPA